MTIFARLFRRKPKKVVLLRQKQPLGLTNDPMPGVGLYDGQRYEPIELPEEPREKMELTSIDEYWRHT